MNVEQKISEIRRYFDRTRIAREGISTAETARALRDAWEDYLDSFGKTIGRLIATSLSHTASKKFGWRLKNASNGEDEGLAFLREARNQVHHALNPFADFREPSVEIGGLASIVGGGPATFHFSNNIINGVNTGTFDLEVSNGKVVKMTGATPSEIVEIPSSVRLIEIYSENKNRRYGPPGTVFGKPVCLDDPMSLADEAFDGLSALIKECEALLKRM